MKLRPVLSLALLLLAACETAQVGDEREVAIGVGGVQPALSATAELARRIQACEGCMSMPALSAHLREAFDCETAVEDRLAAQSPCSEVNGLQAVAIALESCDLGVGDVRFSGSLQVAQQGDARPVEVRFDEQDPYGAASCLMLRGDGADLTLELDGQYLGREGQIVAVQGKERVVARTTDVSRREGSWTMQFLDAQGIGYDVKVEGSELDRREGELLPHGGSLEFDGDGRRLEIRFDESSGILGEAELRHGDESETIDLL